MIFKKKKRTNKTEKGAKGDKVELKTQNKVNKCRTVL